MIFIEPKYLYIHIVYSMKNRELNKHESEEILNRFKRLQLYSETNISTGGSLNLDYSKMKQNVFFFTLAVIGVIGTGYVLGIPDLIKLIQMDCMRSGLNIDEMKKCIHRSQVEKQFTKFCHDVLASVKKLPIKDILNVTKEITRVFDKNYENAKPVAAVMIGTFAAVWKCVNYVVDKFTDKTKSSSETKQNEISREISTESTGTSEQFVNTSPNNSGSKEKQNSKIDNSTLVIKNSSETKHNERSRERDENTSTSEDTNQKKRSREKDENTSTRDDTNQKKRSREKDENTSTRKDTKNKKKSRKRDENTSTSEHTNKKKRSREKDKNTSTNKDTKQKKRSREKDENTSTSKDTNQNKKSRKMSKTNSLN